MKMLENGAIEIARDRRKSDGACYVLAMRQGALGLPEYVTWRAWIVSASDGVNLTTEGYDHGCYFLDILSAAYSFNHRLDRPSRLISEEMVVMARQVVDSDERTVEDTLSLAHDLADRVIGRGA